MAKWQIILILMMVIPFTYSVVEVEYSCDGNTTWKNVIYIDQNNTEALQHGIQQNSECCFRAKNETTDWGYACTTTKEGLDSLGLTLVISIGMVAALLLYLAFKLEDPNHFFLKLLIILSAVTMLLLIPVAVMSPDSTPVTFYRLFLYFFVAFWVYIMGFVTWWVFQKLREVVTR